jgi:Flp pilus assembly protein TadG
MGNRRPAQRERGAAAVEFALVVPLLLMLVFGIISYGYMLSFRQSISQAAAEGARAAAVATSDSDRQAVAYDAVEDALGATCAVDADPLTCSADASDACCLAVTVTWDYAGDDTKPKLMFKFALPKTLSYTSTVQVSTVEP